MLVSIEKIKISDRIRKDFGNIQELADDIQQNGLINPPVVTQDFSLIAGERRIRAMKLLGYQQTEVRVMSVKDAEQALNIEISENEIRKDFSKAERVDYMKRLWRIEAAKAKDRTKAGTLVENSTEVGRSDNIVAERFGLKKDNMRREIAIVDNKDLLTQEDFADWDEGRLSTNKAYQRIKAALNAATQENKNLQRELTATKQAKFSPLSDLSKKAYEDTIDTLNEKLAEKSAELDRSRNEAQRKINELEEKLLVKDNTPTDYYLNTPTNAVSANQYILDITTKVRDLLENDLAPLEFNKCLDYISTNSQNLLAITQVLDMIDTWSARIRRIVTGNEAYNEIYSSEYNEVEITES